MGMNKEQRDACANNDLCSQLLKCRKKNLGQGDGQGYGEGYRCGPQRMACANNAGCRAMVMKAMTTTTTTASSGAGWSALKAAALLGGRRLAGHGDHGDHEKDHDDHEKDHGSGYGIMDGGYYHGSGSGYPMVMDGDHHAYGSGSGYHHYDYHHAYGSGYHHAAYASAYESGYHGSGYGSGYYGSGYGSGYYGSGYGKQHYKKNDEYGFEKRMSKEEKQACKDNDVCKKYLKCREGGEEKMEKMESKGSSSSNKASSGLRIKGARPSIELGTNGDVKLTRTGENQLRIDANVMLKNLMVDGITVDGVPLKNYVARIIAEELAKADGAPPATPEATVSLMFPGDFATVVGDKKELFLNECTADLSDNGALDVKCSRVRPGSIIVDVSGSGDAVDSAVAQATSNGLDLASFESLGPAEVLDDAAPATTEAATTTEAMRPDAAICDFKADAVIEAGTFYTSDGKDASCKSVFKQMGDLVFDTGIVGQSGKVLFEEHCCRVAMPNANQCAEYKANAMLEAGGFYTQDGKAASCKSVFKEMGDLVFDDFIVGQAGKALFAEKCCKAAAPPATTEAETTTEAMVPDAAICDFMADAVVEAGGFYTSDGKDASCKSVFKQMGDLVFDTGIVGQGGKDLFEEKCCRVATPNTDQCAEYKADEMLEAGGFYTQDGKAASCKSVFKEMGDLVFEEFIVGQAGKALFAEKCCKAAAPPTTAEAPAATTTEAGDPCQAEITECMNDPDCSSLMPATTTTKGISAGGAWAALQAAALFGGRRLEGMTDDQMSACETMDICSQLMMCKENEMYSGMFNTTMDMDTTTEAEAPTTTEAEAPTTSEAEAPTTSENVIFSGLFNTTMDMDTTTEAEAPTTTEAEEKAGIPNGPPK